MAEAQAQQSSPEPVQDLSGTTVGRFAIRVRLGAGGMGEVYRADDTRLKRPVALKRVAPELRADEAYRRRFLREAERASSLNDPHIAGLYDVFEANGESFLVMEYIEGQTLRARLERRLELEEVLAIVLQCAEGLAAAHQKGVVHCDIKPENIMLTAAGQVKILDFGVAKRLPQPGDSEVTTQTTLASLSGTPAYMAPEVLLVKEPDQRADIFALGVVFYEGLTGRHPFRAETFVATADRILHEPAPPLGLPSHRAGPELEHIVQKMLAKNPAERYATAADLVADLRAPERALSRPAERVLPAVRPKKKYLSVWQLALLVAVVVLAAVALWQLFKPPVPPAKRIQVAALPFANQTGTANLDAFRLTMTQMLVLDLTGSPNLRVLPYERLLEITRGLEAQGKDISSPDAIQAIANFTNSDYVLAPSVFVVGNRMRATVEFRDARTGETRGVTQAERPLTGSAEETLYAMLNELTDGIQKYFKNLGRGEEYALRPPASRPQTVTTAYELTEGKNALARGDYARALDSFARVVEREPSFPLAYAWIGQIYGLLGYDDKAREASVKAAQLVNVQTPVTDAFFIEANLAERKYDFSAAEQKYLELIRLYPDDPVWYVSLAGVYEKQGQYPRARTQYEQALLQDPNYVVAHQQLGILYSRMGELGQATAHIENALNLYRALNNREGQAHAWADLGEVLRLKRDYAQARREAQASLELSQTLRNDVGVLRATKLLGDISFSEGQYPEARRYYQRVLSASRELKNNHIVVFALMNTGVAYSREGDLANAVAYYQRSLEQGQLYGDYKDWPSLRGRAMTLTNLGAILIQFGPGPERGLALVQEALLIFEKMNATWWVGHSHALLGIHYMNTARYQQGLDQLHQAQALFRTIEDKEMLAYTTYYLGRLYFLQNQYERAAELLGQALLLGEETKDDFRIADAKVHLGRVYRRLGDSAQARVLLGEALKAIENQGYGELLPDLYHALGELHWGGGEQGRAHESFQRAAALWKEPHISEFSIEARSFLGLLEGERGNLAEALAHCQSAVAAARRLQRPHTLAQARINLARVYLLQNEPGKALEALQELTTGKQGSVGLEFAAQAFYLQSKALQGLGKTEKAKASYLEGRAAIQRLQQTLAAVHRERFAARRDIQPLLR